jgi:hypothetical protein
MLKRVVKEFYFDWGKLFSMCYGGKTFMGLSAKTAVQPKPDC